MDAHLAPGTALVGPDTPTEVADARLDAVHALHVVRDSLRGFREDVDATLHSTLDWREHVRAHPHLTVGLCLFVGFLLGSRNSRF